MATTSWCSTSSCNPTDAKG